MSRYAERRAEPGICDFTFGNPHEMPLPGLVEAIRRHAIPLNKDWFAYKTSEAGPQAFLAERLTLEFSLSFEPEDVALTNGAFAAISVAFRLLLDVGDEAIFSTPAWFSYEPMLLTADVTPRKVPLLAGSFILMWTPSMRPLHRGRALSSSTHLIIRRDGFTAETLVAFAQILDHASERIGRRIFLLSDEPYRRIRFDDRGSSAPRGFIHGSCDVQLCKGPARTWSASWLFGCLATHAVGGEKGHSKPHVRRSSGAWMVFSQCNHSVRHP